MQLDLQMRPNDLRPALAEHCRSLLARLEIGTSVSAGPIQILGLTSCGRGEGVTTVAAHLAATAADSLGRPVCLVDCNFADPAVHRLFQTPIGPGLRDALWENGRAQEFLKSSSFANLSLLTAGEPKHGAALAFSSPNFVRLLEELKQEFGLVVVDFPPFGQGAPAGLGSVVDGVLLVLEAEKVRWEVAQRATASLAETGGNLLGVVMNKRQYHVPGWLYRTL